MKLLTFKDFIIYNNPCFSCQENALFKIIAIKLDDSMARIPMETVPGRGIILYPLVTPQLVDMDLKINYVDGISNLKILHKSNKIISNIDVLTDYLSEHMLYAISKCGRCGSYIQSNYLEFDLNMKIVKPLSIRKEFVLIEKNNKMYSLSSNYSTQESILRVAKIDSSDRETVYKDLIELKMPLQPLYKFKDKEVFISKIKTLLLFS